MQRTVFQLLQKLSFVTDSPKEAKLLEFLNDYDLYDAKEISPAIIKLKDKDPTTMEEALAFPEASLWQKAMDEEIENVR